MPQSRLGLGDDVRAPLHTIGAERAQLEQFHNGHNHYQEINFKVIET